MPSADSEFCKGVDPDSWSPGNLFGTMACGWSNLADATVGVGITEAADTAQKATGDAKDATVAAAEVAAANSSTIFGSLGLSFGVGIGLSACAIGGLGF